jgi:hypothetical protein
MANGGEKTWTDEGKFYLWENYSEDDLTEVREPLRAKVAVHPNGNVAHLINNDTTQSDMSPGWRIVEMIEVTPANNPPTA